MWPSYNGETSFEVSFSPNSLRTKIEAGLDNIRKVSLFVTSAYDITGREKKINGLVKFTVPFKVSLHLSDHSVQKLRWFIAELFIIEAHLYVQKLNLC